MPRRYGRTIFCMVVLGFMILATLAPGDHRVALGERAYIVHVPPGAGAAIVPVAGSMVLVRFHPTKPISIMHIHSVDDPRALYNGGLGPPFPMTNSRVEHPPVEQQLAKWIAYDGCRSTPTVAKRLAGEGNTATKLVYAPCTSGAQIILWKLTGSGHVWPGSSKNFERLLGKPTHLFDTSKEIGPV